MKLNKNWIWWKDEKVNEGHTSTDNDTESISNTRLLLVTQKDGIKNNFIKCT